MDNKITFLYSKFEKGDTGELADGITIVVDGKFRLVLDKIIADSREKYPDCVSVIKEAVFRGIDSIIGDIKA